MDGVGNLLVLKGSELALTAKRWPPLFRPLVPQLHFSSASAWLFTNPLTL